MFRESVYGDLSLIRMHAVYQAQTAISRNNFGEYLNAEMFYRISNGAIQRSYGYVEDSLKEEMPMAIPEFPKWVTCTENTALQDFEEMTETYRIRFSDGEEIECEDIPF